MSLEACKITSYQHSVKDLPDIMVNSAAQLKAIFDSRTDNEIKQLHNALVDYLIANLITLAQVDEKIAQAVFESGAADMQRATFVQPGTDVFKPTAIPTATQEQTLAGTAQDVFITPHAAKPVYEEAVKKGLPMDTVSTLVDTTTTIVFENRAKRYYLANTITTLNLALWSGETTPTWADPSSFDERIVVLKIATGTTLTVSSPSFIKWIGEPPTFAAEKTYMVSIVPMALPNSTVSSDWAAIGVWKEITTT